MKYVAITPKKMAGVSDAWFWPEYLEFEEEPTKSREISEAELKELTKFQRALYTRYKYKDSDEKQLRTFLEDERIGTFNDTLNELLAQVGCGGQKGALTNNAIRDILVSESEEDAASIVRTFNRELINRIAEVGKGARREDYAEHLREWEDRRGDFKSSQIAEWTESRTRHFATSLFFERNQRHLSGRGSAVLRGPDPAAEPICQGWINRGRVPLEEALANPPPYHLNCPHHWEIKSPKVTWYRRRGVCPLLWSGE